MSGSERADEVAAQLEVTASAISPPAVCATASASARAPPLASETVVLRGSEASAAEVGNLQPRARAPRHFPFPVGCFFFH